MLFPHRLSACALLLGTLTMASTVSAEDTFRQHDAHIHGVVEFNIAQDGNELLMEITAPGADIVGFEHAPSNKQQQQALEHAIQQLNNANQLFAFPPSAKCQLSEAHVTETLTEQNTHTGHEHDSHTGHEHEEHDHGNHAGHEHEEHDHDSHAGHEHEEHDHDSHAGHEHEEHDHDNHAGHEHEEHDHDSHAGHEHEEHDHDSHAGHEHEEHDHDSHAGHEHEEHAHGEFSAQYVFRCSDISQLGTIDVSWFKAFPTTEKITIQAITEASQKADHLTPTNTLFRF